MTHRPREGAKVQCGITASGIPIFEVMGESSLSSISNNPDVRSIAVKTNTASIAGKMQTTVFKPFAAPSQKAEYTSVFLTEKRRILIIRRGIT